MPTVYQMNIVVFLQTKFDSNARFYCVSHAHAYLLQYASLRTAVKDVKPTYSYMFNCGAEVDIAV